MTDSGLCGYLVIILKEHHFNCVCFEVIQRTTGACCQQMLDIKPKEMFNITEIKRTLICKTDVLMAVILNIAVFWDVTRVI